MPTCSHSVSPYLESKSGSLWGGDGATLFRWRQTERDTWPTQELAGGSQIYSLMESKSGEIWVGMLQGLAVHDGDRFVRDWSAADGLPPGAVRAIHEDEKGNIWVGTYGGGLCRIGADSKVTRIGTKQGLHEAIVSRIVADGLGNLVLQGNRALSLVSEVELNEVADGKRARIYPRVFDSGPGIDAFEGNGGATPLSCRTPDGALWFPTQEGLVRFDPSLVARVETPPQVHIESLTVQGHLYRTDRPITVPPGTRDLTFQFTAPTFVDPEHTRFEYQLEGYDDEWIDNDTERKAHYTQVPAGNYQFRVRAANSDGVWSEDSAPLDFKLEPWIHETLWFRWLLGSVAILAIFGAIGLRARALKLRAQELETEVDVRTAELVAVTEHLEERVEERTKQLEEDMAKRELLETQLHESQRLEAIGRLAGGLAHDFNNYLTVVKADCEMTLDSLSEQQTDAREYVEEVLEVSDRAADLTRQLLAYSRQQVLEPRLVDVNEVIGSIHDMLTRLVPEEVELTLELEHEVESVLIDPGQFEQIIVNLVINARDALEGIGSITIKTESRDVAQDAAHERGQVDLKRRTTVSVADCGHGMDQETLEQIFEPFYSTKPTGKGTGLGLASVSGIVEQSGGEINVTSSPGRGTVFEVSFPACEAAPTAETRVPVAPLPTKTRTARIAVCEDQGRIARLLAALLESIGHQVVAFERPDELLRRAEDPDWQFDLLITDMIMPGMNGRELVTRLKVNRPELRTLYISGYSGEAGVPALHEGQSAFLRKPFGRAELNRHVSALLGAQTIPG